MISPMDSDDKAGFGGLQIIDDGDAQAAPLAPVAPISMEQPLDATPVAQDSSGGAHAKVLIIDLSGRPRVAKTMANGSDPGCV